MTLPEVHMHRLTESQFGVDLVVLGTQPPVSSRRPAPLEHRIADRFFSLGSTMSRVILLIVCALSMASCLVMQTGAMRSAGERPPQPLFPFPRVRP